MLLQGWFEGEAVRCGLGIGSNNLQRIKEFSIIQKKHPTGYALQDRRLLSGVLRVLGWVLLSIKSLSLLQNSIRRKFGKLFGSVDRCYRPQNWEHHLRENQFLKPTGDWHCDTLWVYTVAEGVNAVLVVSSTYGAWGGSVLETLHRHFL